MKTMHRTSTASLAIGSVFVAAWALTLTALTGTGAGGAYGFLFAGLLVTMIFLMWPERTRPLRGGRRRAGMRRARAGRAPR
jgi:hypothetical protein